MLSVARSRRVRRVACRLGLAILVVLVALNVAYMTLGRASGWRYDEWECAATGARIWHPVDYPVSVVTYPRAFTKADHHWVRSGGSGWEFWTWLDRLVRRASPDRVLQIARCSGSSSAEGAMSAYLLEGPVVSQAARWAIDGGGATVQWGRPACRRFLETAVNMVPKFDPQVRGEALARSSVLRDGGL